MQCYLISGPFHHRIYARNLLEHPTVYPKPHPKPKHILFFFKQCDILCCVDPQIIHTAHKKKTGCVQKQSEMDTKIQISKYTQFKSSCHKEAVPESQTKTYPISLYLFPKHYKKKKYEKPFRKQTVQQKNNVYIPKKQ